MKKFPIAIALMLSLLLLLCSAASADTITAMAIEINPEHLEKTASYARILGYNEEKNTLTVELIVPEVFDYQDIKALKPGDSIYTDSHEVLIDTIEVDDWGTYLINGGKNDEDVVSLTEDLNGNFRPDLDDDYVWLSLAVIECPVKDSLLFLDYIDEDSGNVLELPVVHPVTELVSRLKALETSEVYPVGLATNNVYVVFDSEGNLATIQRYYVPWQ